MTRKRMWLKGTGIWPKRSSIISHQDASHEQSTGRDCQRQHISTIISRHRKQRYRNNSSINPVLSESFGATARRGNAILSTLTSETTRSQRLGGTRG